MIKTFNGLCQNNQVIFNQGIASPDQTWLQRMDEHVKILAGAQDPKLWLAPYTYRLAHTDADLVVAVDSFTIKLAVHIRRLLHKHYRVVSWIHFSLPDAPAVKTNDLLKADAHIAISSGIQQQYAKLGVKRSQVALTYNPTDDISRKVTMNTDHVLRLVYVGRVQLHGQKNLAYLFNALHQTKTAFHLDVYGDGDDLSAAKQLVNQLHMSPYITFHGWVDHVWSHVQSANALILTSKFEGFPMALLEALVRGLPVICPNLSSGSKDIVIPGVNGRTFDLDNEGELVDILNHPENFYQMKQDQVITSVAKFSFPAYIRRFENALKAFASTDTAQPQPLKAKLAHQTQESRV